MINKKALIISLGARTTGENYGAILQMYCFCKVLENRYKIQPTILDYMSISTSGYKTNNVAFEFLSNHKKTLKSRIKNILFSNSTKKRFLKNIQFLESEIGTTDIISYDNIENFNFDYDYYVAESDVIWDPTFRSSGFDDVFFLNKKCFDNGAKVVYSAGLGDCIFTNNELEQFKEKVKKLKYVSVREKFASDYILKNCSLNIPFVLDPTLLINFDEYPCENRIKLPQCGYVLVYTPGFNNRKMIADAKDYAKKYNKKIIIITRAMGFRDLVISKVDVSVKKFISLVSNCFAFFCDSFHGVCLSVVFKKTFFVYNRPDGKKIFDICERLFLTERIVDNRLEDSPIDYDKVYELLNNERKKSFDFLDNAFSN